ncbi:MAG TPA: hypothetical protein VIM51_05365 [Desulfosporosinus sp.]
MSMNMHGWCPMISSKAEGKSLSKCTTTDCAWWDDEDNCCVVFAINKYVRKITNNGMYDLHDINSTLSSLKD